MKKNLKNVFASLMILLIASLFFACAENDEIESADEVSRAAVGSSWNFQSQDSNKKLVDYSTNNTTMTADITYLDGMTLLGSQRDFRWIPKQASPGSGATVGCVQTGGATSSGKYFLKIDSVQGPFKITLVYTDTSASNSGRYIEIFINGSSVKKCGNTSGLSVISSTYEYTGTSKVPIQLGCSGGIRLYDVKLSAVSGSSSSSSSSSGSTTASSSAATIFNNLKGKKPTTNGWADKYGVSYASPSSVTEISSATYPDAKKRRVAFTDLVKGDSAKFIVVSGDIDLSDGKISDSDKSYFDKFNSDGKRTNGDIVYQIGSNTTIIGINNARLKFGGFQIKGKTNVIIRNVTFYDAHGSTEVNTSKDSSSKASIDALEISNGSNGVWVDHCKFTDGTCNDMVRNYHHDGAFDIKKGVNITVSWCEFTNHDKVMLVGSGDTGEYLTATDRQVTMHHNYFHKTTQRTPRTRGTQMHLYNNYWNDIGVSDNTGYCMGPGVAAQFIVENNYFGSFVSSSTKVVDYYDTSANPAIVYSSGNNKTVARSSYDKGTSKPWTPSYSYSLEANSGLTSSIPKGAGPTLTSF